MTQHELLNKLAEIIDESKTGILATVDAEGRPHLRWMTPAVLRDRQSAIFAITCPAFSKALHLADNPRVEWMFQSKVLNTVINIHGIVNMIETPSLKNEVLEVLAPRLEVLWKIDCPSSDYVILETVIEDATYYRPLENLRETVKF